MNAAYLSLTGISGCGNAQGFLLKDNNFNKTDFVLLHVIFPLSRLRFSGGKDYVLRANVILSGKAISFGYPHVCMVFF